MTFEEQLRNTIDMAESHLREFNAPCSAFEDLDLFEKDCMSKQRVKETFRKYIDSWETSGLDTDFDFEGIMKELGLEKN